MEARLDAALLAAAVQLLQNDGKPHKMADLFGATLTFEKKLGDFFSTGDSKDKARFNALITPQVMEENRIDKICGRPVTWQYQG